VSHFKGENAQHGSMRILFVTRFVDSVLARSAHIAPPVAFATTRINDLSTTQARQPVLTNRVRTWPISNREIPIKGSWQPHNPLISSQTVRSAAAAAHHQRARAEQRHPAL